jgi:hypothetical protein
MPSEVLQREFWRGNLFRSAPAGLVTNPSAARREKPSASLWSHQVGWELRLMIDGGILQRSQVCRSNDEVLDTQEQWKAAMVGKGWA